MQALPGHSNMRNLHGQSILQNFVGVSISRNMHTHYGFRSSYNPKLFRTLQQHSQQKFRIQQPEDRWHVQLGEILKAGSGSFLSFFPCWYNIAYLIYQLFNSPIVNFALGILYHFKILFFCCFWDDSEYEKIFQSNAQYFRYTSWQFFCYPFLTYPRHTFYYLNAYYVLLYAKVFEALYFFFTSIS